MKLTTDLYKKDINNEIIGSISLGKDITKSVKAKQELAMLNIAIENSLNEVSIFNAKNLKFTFANKVIIQNLGYTLEELTKMTPIDIAPEFTKEKALKKLAPLKTGKVKKIQFETIRQRKDKTTYPIEAHISKFSIQGEEHFLALINDITERKKTEQALIESESRFKTIIENAGDAMYMANFKGDILQVNDLACKALGYSKKELLSMKIFEIDANVIKDKHPKKLWSTLKPNNSQTLETKHKRKDGSIFPVEIRIGVAIVNNEKVTLGFARDITERKVFEKNLIESERLLKEAQRLAKIGYWELNLLDNKLTWSDEVFRIFNLKPQEFKPTYAKFLEEIHPNDRDKVNKTYLDSLSNKKPYEITHRLLLNSNEIKYVLEKFYTEFNEEGKPIRSLGTVQDITKSKEAALKLIKSSDELKASEQKFRRLYEKSGDAIMIGKNGKFIDVNNAAVKMFGYASKKEFLAVHPKKLSPKLQPSGVKSFENSILMLSTAIEKGTHRFEWQFFKKNGKIFPVEILLTSISNEPNNKIIHGVLRDITKRKEAEIELTLATKKINASEKRLRKLFDNSPVSLWEEDISGVLQLINKKIKEVENLKQYLDDNSDFVYECASKIIVLNVNNSSLDLLGVKTKEELINNLSGNFNLKSFETLKEELVFLASKKIEFKRETEFVKSDGKVISVLLKLVLLGNSRVIVSMSDVTELKEAKKKAEESDRLKTEFISNMSHEIRTPMNGIMGFSELLADPGLANEKRKYFVQIIKNSGKQLLQIIDDIIEISKLGTKQVKVYEEQVNLNDLLLELFSIFDSKAKENKTPLYLKNELSDKQSTIISDRSKLNKIISNLLENALKFTNVGSIAFGYKLKNNSEFPTLEIYVKDTGIGINIEDQKLIFERFVQAKKEVSKKVKGLGLGLSIAKENTTLLGGEITVESIKGKGTTFFVAIPYKPVFDEIKITNETLQETQTILIVEDEEINYLYLDTLLKDMLKINCIVLHAKNGKEAIAICKKNVVIDFILMDLKMPVMNGYEATKEIKKLYPNIPIIAQTAYSRNEEEEKAILAGCDAFISKPITKNSLFNIINKFAPQV